MGLFQQHRNEFKDSPWAGEAEMHLGCEAQYNGRLDEAKFSFDWILDNTKPGTDMYQKAKLRMGVLHMDRGELVEAENTFAGQMATENRPNRRTYASYWLVQLAILRGNEVALRDCAQQALAWACEKNGDAETAGKLRREQAPSAKGFSGAEFLDLAAKYGIAATPVVAGKADLGKLGYPHVAHYKDNHFVTVSAYDEKAGKLTIYDSRVGHEVPMPVAGFVSQWSGLSVLLGETDAAGMGLEVASAATVREIHGGCCGLPRFPGDQGTDGGDGPPGEPEGGDIPDDEGGGGGEADEPGGPDKGCPPYGLPTWNVSMVNMNLVVRDVPIWYHPPVGPGVEFKLTYNSLDSLVTVRPFGEKWVLNYASYLMELPNGSAQVIGTEGRSSLFSPDGSGGFNAEAGVFTKITKVAAYTYDLEYPNGTILRYGVPAGMTGSSTSLLLSITDKYGNGIQIGHNANGAVTSVTHPKAGTWNVIYNGDSRIERIDDPFGRSCTFTYDVEGLLVGQTDMGGVAYSYTYTEKAALADDNQTVIPDELFLDSITTPNGTTGFFTEPANGTQGSTMWQNYRVTVSHPEDVKEVFFFTGSSRLAWHLHRSTGDINNNSPKTVFNYAVAQGKGIISSRTYPNGRQATNSGFDANRLPETVVKAGETYTYTYNSEGRVLTATDPKGNTWSYQYEANGIDLDQAFGPDGTPILDIDYNALRDPVSVKDALGITTGKNTLTAYLANGQVDAITDPNGDVTAFSYDTGDNLEQVHRNGTLLATFGYDAIGRRTMSADNSGYTLLSEYNNLNKPTKTTYPDGTFQQIDWACCMVDRIVDREGRATHFRYDGLKRLIEKEQPGGHITKYGYDARSNLTRLEDNAGNATTWLYDYASPQQTVTKTYATGLTEVTNFNTNGTVKDFTDRMGRSTTYAYDANLNLSTVTPTGLPVVSYTHDNYNRIATRTDGVGLTTFGYDIRSLLASVDGPWDNDVVTFSYDDGGRATGQSIDGVASGVTYDTLGRIAASTSALGTFTNTYVGDSGRLAQVLYPNNQVSGFTWQNANGDFRLSEISNLKSAGGANLSRFDYTYTPSGRIATWEQALGAAAATEYGFSYDPIDQLTGAVLSDKASGDELASFNYGYDKATNRSSEFRKRKVIVGDRQDQHNNLNQTTVSNRQGRTHVRGKLNEGASVTVNGKVAQLNTDFSFDAWLDLPAGEQTISVAATDEKGNAANAAWQIYNDEVGNYTLSYDDAGNLLGDGTRVFEWDSRNRLTAIKTGDHRSEFDYDSLDRRVRIVEKDRINSGAPWTETLNNTYLWVGNSLAEKRDATGGTVLVRYLGQGEQRVGGVDAGLYYYTRDHLGSVRELVDSSGNVRARYDYGLWGRREKLEGDLEVEFGFTGHHLHAETGLYLALYRVYDAKMGRWLSADPLERRIGSLAELLPEGSNLYGYAGNNPVNMIDPDGEYVLVVAAVALAAGGVALAIYWLNDFGQISDEIGDQRRAAQERWADDPESCPVGVIENTGVDPEDFQDLTDSLAEALRVMPNTMFTGPVDTGGRRGSSPIVRPKPVRVPSRPGYTRVRGYENADGTRYTAPHYRRPPGNPDNAPYPNNNQYPRGR